MTDKKTMCALLRAHISSRPGLDSRDYASDWRDKEGIAALRHDQRNIARDGKEARLLLSFVEGRDSITADDIAYASKRAFSGRLSFAEAPDGTMRLDYCTGQYYPTEYRAAACALLASVVSKYWGDDGNDVHKLAKGYFGRGVHSRWFD